MAEEDGEETPWKKAETTFLGYAVINGRQGTYWPKFSETDYFLARGKVSSLTPARKPQTEA